VVLVDALGSTPQDTGAKMLVTPAGLLAGTIGGGRVEAQAIALAQELLTSAATAPRFVNWTLKGDVGMTCGGSVKLYFEPHAATGPWPIVIFGAGHVVQALVPVLLPLACTLTVIDPRADWLARLPAARNLRTITHENPADLIPTLPANAFVLCMTKGHSTDRPVLQRALAERTFPYLGAIGSAAKATILRQELRRPRPDAGARRPILLPHRRRLWLQPSSRNRAQHRRPVVEASRYPHSSPTRVRFFDGGVLKPASCMPRLTSGARTLNVSQTSRLR